MYPIVLDLARISVLLIGSGPLLERREKQLREAGAKKLTVHAGSSAISMEEYAIIMVAGLTRSESETIAQAARAAGKPVNVEDINDLCDFYFTANVRRGDLLIAVSTGGASPTLARRVRDMIGRMFGEEWAARTKEIAEFRRSLKASGKDVLAESDTFLKEKGWLQ